MIWQSGDVVRVGSEFRNLALFWFGPVTVGWLQMILITRGIRVTFGADNHPGWALLIASAMIGAIPLTFQVRWLVEAIVAPQQSLPAPWVTYLNICVINIVFSLIQFLMIERWPLFQVSGDDKKVEPEPESAAETSNASAPYVGMLRRRPDGLNGVIRYMHMEDHYLRVATNEGSGLALHRMSDAVEDLSASDGMQVHKSWWVSHGSVKEIRNQSRRKVIVTRDGTEIPVGRTFEKAMRAAGWI